MNIKYVESATDTSAEYVCPNCHGKVSYDIVPSKTEEAEYHWECKGCSTEYEEYELHLEILENITQEVIDLEYESYQEKDNKIIEFDYDKIVQQGIVVNCKTKEQAKNLLKWADSKGLEWYSGEKYLKDIWRWTASKQNTCYNLFEGLYGDIDYYCMRYYTILSYEEALKEAK